MPTSLLGLFVLGPAAVVVAALSVMLWRERRSAADGRIALLSGAVLTLWAVVATALAYSGSFQPQAAETVPPVGVTLVIVLSVLFVSLAVSVSLRGLLTRQADLIRVHLWRLVGIVFLVLMVRGEAPALWALPAGIGDILIAITAPWIARHVETPRGRRRAVIWNLFGMADLIVAVGLGTMMSPGATQLFETTPTTEVMTRFPLALVPTFLVPLAFTLHVVSLWQLLGVRWLPHPTAAHAVSR
jgi:hypothetical protein